MLAKFLVSAGGGAPTLVEAANWLTALGNGLDELGVVARIDRLACEVLRNGTVVARDVRTGKGFVVQPLSGAAPTAESAGDPVSEDEVFVLGDDPGDEAGFALPPGTDEVDLGDGAEEGFSMAGMGVLEDGAADWDSGLVATLIDTIRSAPSDLAAWQSALEVAQELVTCESGAVMRCEPNMSLRFVGTVGPAGHKIEAVKLPQGAGIAGFCVSRVVSLLVNRPKHDPRFFKDMDEATGYETQALLCVPVAYEGFVYGCLELLNPPNGAAFTRSDLELVELVTAALADRLV